jgi:hypothetical protein
MAADQLKELEANLWTAADKLRVDSGLKACEYSTPILGLIFLRFASIRYNKVKAEIAAEIAAQKKARFYQKITDIYTQCSADYNVETKSTKDFFATVQNKLHWAITGQTVSELIAARVDSTKENMGLTTWKNGPKGSIRKTDVGIAKNYLNEKELNGLNRIVTMYLEYI